jgi:hypothetical protein
MPVVFGDERALSHKRVHASRVRFSEGARLLTPAQIHAIRAAMQVFVEDDLAGGASAASRWCDHCRTPRPAAGFITYDGGDLCNDCATEYELARATGRVNDVAAFIARRVRRPYTRTR